MTRTAPALAVTDFGGQQQQQKQQQQQEQQQHLQQVLHVNIVNLAWTNWNYDAGVRKLVFNHGLGTASEV
jgi:hypothetical protein